MDYPFHLENPLHNSSDDKFTTLFRIESHHIIPSNSIDSGTSSFSVRFQIISIINHLSISLDPFLAYLAINYLDRFLSTQSVPEGKPWILKLIAISCISLALKMMKTDYSASNIYNDGCGLIFDSQTIKRMEFLILGALKWRMRSITPFAFVDFFVSLFSIKDSPSCQALNDRATQIIFNSQTGLWSYEFKPSVVAASALLFACHELFPSQFPSFMNAISCCSYVHKDDLYKCYNAIHEIDMDGYQSALRVDTLSISSTPINVLDMRFCSSTSTCIETKTETEIASNTIVKVEATNETGTGSETGTGCIILERDLKRRKNTCFGTQNSFQLSQVQHC